MSDWTELQVPDSRDEFPTDSEEGVPQVPAVDEAKALKDKPALPRGPGWNFAVDFCDEMSDP
jgi:hypothetical protein